MKKVILFLIVYMLSIDIAISQCSSPRENYHGPELLYKYWQLRKQFNKHFIKFDMDEDGNLLSDGIGTWDNNSNQYTKAGFSLPAAHLYLTYRDGDGENVYSPNGDLLNTEGEDGTNNVLNYGADVTYTTGMYIAMLASEYELLGRNKLYAEQDKTLKELFLALQAVKRLDMTANRLANKHCCSCSGDCLENPNYTGYSGFLLRDDVPASFHNEIDDETDPDDWRVGGIKAQYGDSDFSSNILCNFRDDEFKNRIAGHDQIIGLLFGMAFVKKYVPETAFVSYDGIDYNILSIAQSLAFNMVFRIYQHPTRKIKYPGCPGEGFWGPALTGDHGGDASATFYAMTKALDFIMPNQNIPNNEIDYLAWQAYITSVADGHQDFNNDNRRMALELVTIGNTNYSSALDIKYFYHGHDLSLMQWIARGILHDISLDNRPLDRMKKILCSLSCEGPCNQEEGYWGPDFSCSNSGGNGWCSGERWKHAIGRVKFCQDTPAGQKSSGYDFMLAYNLSQLAEWNEYYSGEDLTLRPPAYFNPFEIVEQDQHEEEIDHILGQDYICDHLETPYAIPDNSSTMPFDNFEWTVSDNLTLVGESSSSETIIRHPQGAPEGAAWIRVSFTDGTCEYAWQKNIWIGDPSFPFVSTETNNCAFTVELSVPPAGVANFNWTISGPDEYVYVASNEHNIIVHAITDAETLGPISYSVHVQNPCNSFFTSGTVTIPECRFGNGDGDGSPFPPIIPFISPNPATDHIDIELQHTTFDTFSDGGPMTYHLIDQYSNVKKTIQTTNIFETMDVSEVPNGMYFIIGNNSKTNISSSPFIIQH